VLVEVTMWADQTEYPYYTFNHAPDAEDTISYKVKVDAADPAAYLEAQMIGGTTPGTANEENLKVEKSNVAGDNDIMQIRHTTHGTTSACCCWTIQVGDFIGFDTNGHLSVYTPV